jgi:hypothetical protein
LNLTGVDGYCGDVEAGKTTHLHGIQLRGIEPPPYRRKSPSQGPPDRCFCRSAECSRRVRIRQPHEVPANATNPRIQFFSRSAHRLSPSLGKRLLAQSELARQDASIPQEHRIYLHCCLLRSGGLSNRLRPESDRIEIEAGDSLAGDGPDAGVGVGAGTPFHVETDLVLVAPSRLSGYILPSLMARRAAKCFSTSIFLIRLIGTLADQFISSAACIGRRGRWVGFNAGCQSLC